MGATVHPELSDEMTTLDTATAGEPPKDRVVFKALNAAQVELQVDNKVRRNAGLALLLFCFVDCLGTVLFFPAGAILCQRSDGGPMAVYGQLLWSQQHEHLDLASLPSLAPAFVELGQKLNGTFATPAIAAEIVWGGGRIPGSGEFHAGIGMDKAFAGIPFSFSTAMNMLLVFGNVAGGIAGGLWPSIAEKLGYKNCCVLCMFGGMAGYLVMWLAGTRWHSFWGYAAGQVINGVFSGGMVLVTIMFTKMFPKGPERDQWTGMIMLMTMMGGGMGALILVPFTSGAGNDVFNAAWIGIGGTVLSLLLVCRLVTEPARGSKDASRGEMQALGEVKKKSAHHDMRIANKILWIALVAGALDGAGDEGTRIARGTILQNAWPETNTISFQNILILSLIGVAMLALGFMSALKAQIGLGGVAVLGCLATLATQLTLMLTTFESYGPFLAVWYSGKVFGFMSSFAGSFIINDFASEESMDKWQGRQAMIGPVFDTIITLSMASVYDGIRESAAQNGDDISPTSDSVRGRTTLAITCCISFLAVVAYLPLLGLVPKPKNDAADLAKQAHTVEEYEAMPAAEVRKLTMEEIMTLEMARMADGKIARVFPWGDYHAERPDIDGMMLRAKKDFRFMKAFTTDILTSSEKMEGMRESWRQEEEWKRGTDAEGKPNFDKSKARDEMGLWLSEYLDDAGYSNWSTYPSMYKAMFVNAFPPIDPLDDKEPDVDTADLENLMLKFLNVADQHIKTSGSSVKSFASSNFFKPR